MGATEGLNVGREVGWVGKEVGQFDGDEVGKFVGSKVGAAVGIWVG